MDVVRPTSSLQQTYHDLDKHDEKINSNTYETENDVNVTPEKAPRKLHTMTVCMVPPAQYKSVWEAVTRVRTELKDPGLFRWPPHCNLLYPFLDIKTSSDEAEEEFSKEKLQLLGQAVTQCEPFRISLDSFGSFGGNTRGVIFLRPRSFEIAATDIGETVVAAKEETENEDPLTNLQSALFRHFPECPDQQKHGQFTPHMTVSHFTSLQGALEGKAQAETWWDPVEFDVTEIYLLKRAGDDGQFKIIATLPLGSKHDGSDNNLQIHDPAIVFPDMPLEEEAWVQEGRMKMKARRNGNNGRGRRRSGQKIKERIDRGPRRRTTDTPEIIAQKRADRAAKRERFTQDTAGDV